MCGTSQRAVTARLLLLLVLASSVLSFSPQGGRRGSPQKRRVRKEIRNLSRDEYKMYIRGFSTMLSVPTSAGRKLFGPKYINYDDIIARHAVAVPDARGDQGHFVPCFMTFHRAVLLEFETALLSVVPELGAMPYWHFVDDAPGGKYYKRPGKWIFDDFFFGSIVGSEAADYALTDGMFGWRRVPLFGDVEKQLRFPEIAPYYTGSPLGFMRGYTSSISNPYVVRYPSQDLSTLLQGAGALGINERSITAFTTAALDNDLPAWVQRDFDIPLNATYWNSWNKWSFAIDLEFALKTPNPAESVPYLGPGVTGLMHGLLHALIGGFLNTGPDVGATADYGDMGDIITSPNEPLFMLMHANLDRNSLMAQANMQYLNASAARDDVMWGYPKSQAEYSGAPLGCLLHDVINSNANFTDIFEGPPKPQGYTHFDLLDRVRPDNAPYTYDAVTPSALPLFLSGWTNRASKKGRRLQLSEASRE